MKCLRLKVALCLLIIAGQVKAQSDFITNGSRQYNVLERLQIKLGTDSVLNFSSIKPMDRRIVTERLEYIKDLAAEGKISLTAVDKYNIDILLQDNFEWRKNTGDTVLRLKSIFSPDIKTHTAAIGIKKNNFSLFLNPVGALTVGKDNNLTKQTFVNTRGFYIRGVLGNKIGFYTYYRTQQERDPLYVQNYFNQYSAVPGVGYYKKYNVDGFDYFDGRGGIMFKATKGIDIQFAYDKMFIGDGFRSLILSDFSQSFLFLKVNARFWKFNYQNVFAELTSAYKPGNDYLRPKKYMALHYLDFQVSKRVNIAFFENVMFGNRPGGGFELNYLNPVILYQTAQQQVGSPDKLTLGFNVKANAFKNTQLYGQLIINEFLIKEIIHYSNGYYSNKHALQIGGKMIDFLGVKNLDVQAEVNLIRPFVYTHYDSVSNFSNYNQPLAHPLGANLREFIVLAKYQPIPKLQLAGKIIYTEQGLDSAGRNFGSNIFRYYTDNQGIQYGYHIGSGKLAKTLLATLSASYEVTPNIFVDADVMMRSYKVVETPNFNTNIYSIGFRVNMQKRTFDF